MDPQSDVAERAPSRPVRSDVARKGPVFVDLSGRRGRLVRHAGALAGAVCFGYSAVLGMGFAGGTAMAPETLIPGRPVTTEAFGREPKSAPDARSGGRSGAHEHPSEGQYHWDGPDHPLPHSPAEVRPAGARKPTAFARPAPPQSHRAPSARHARPERTERTERRPAARHAPGHQRSAAHKPGQPPHHPGPHKPASPHARPEPHKPPRKPVDPVPEPVKKPPAAKPAKPAKPAEPGPDRPQNPGNGQAKPPANEPEPLVWGPTTPGGINWQALTPFRGGLS
jgi:hypothetical protein